MKIHGAMQMQIFKDCRMNSMVLRLIDMYNLINTFRLHNQKEFTGSHELFFLFIELWVCTGIKGKGIPGGVLEKTIPASSRDFGFGTDNLASQFLCMF